jgi:hypothetical protein
MLNRKKANRILVHLLKQNNMNPNMDMAVAAKALAEKYGIVSNFKRYHVHARCVLADRLRPYLVGFSEPVKSPRKGKRKKQWDGTKYDADHVDLVEGGIKQSAIDQFYASWEWKRLRYDFIKGKQRRCQCCGRTPADGIAIHVDHVKPIRHHWSLRFSVNNLQILCEDCNMGKGSRDETDWRGEPVVWDDDKVVPLRSVP